MKKLRNTEAELKKKYLLQKSVYCISDDQNVVPEIFGKMYINSVPIKKHTQFNLIVVANFFASVFNIKSVDTNL